MPASRGQRLLVYDLRDGHLLAAWHFPQSDFIRALEAASDSHLYLADFRSILSVDLQLMKVMAQWPIAGGVDDIIYAAPDLVVLRTMDGRTVSLDPRTGGRPLEMSPDDDTKAVWAERQGEILYVLFARELKRPFPYGMETYFQGSGFALRAVRISDGALLWQHEWPQAEEQMVGPPIWCGRFYLLRAAEPGRLRIAAAHAQTGRELFAVELDGPQQLWPPVLLVSADRLIVGGRGTVRALQPGTQITADPARTDAEAHGAPRFP